MKPDRLESRGEGFIPYLVVKDAAAAIELYRNAFAADLKVSLQMKDGTIAHAELHLGSATLMLSEEKEEWNMRGPHSLGGCPLTLTLYVADVDAVAKRAEAAGMKIIRGLENHFFGDRMATLEDPYGYVWCLGTRLENVSAELMQQRMLEIYDPE